MALFVSNSHSLFSFAVVFIFSIACLFFTEAYNDGFTVDLIHRDSPKSPFYNSSETFSQRLSKSIRRSFQRAKRFNPTSSSSYSPNDVEADIIVDSGEYLMKIGVGTPPVEVLAVADTGSDLIWTQCKPCIQCFKQPNPIFDPKSSKTYKDISCSSNQCQSLRGTSCGEDKDGSVCQYNVRYGDSSSSTGNLAVETITLGSTDGRPVALENRIIGCGHNNELIYHGKTSGIVGLGGGDVSLVSQTGSGKFSYCLVPISDPKGNGTSKMSFGDNAIVSGYFTVTTPLISGDTFYFLRLEAISVGDKRLDFTASSAGGGEGEGNIIIDSGTTLTMLPRDFYSSLESAVSSKIEAKQTDDPSGNLNLCYEVKSGVDLDVPEITVHFTNADLKLSSLNSFVRVSEDVVCFTFHPNEDLSIFGNLAQINFMVGYDLEEHTVSFMPTPCGEP